MNTFSAPMKEDEHTKDKIINLVYLAAIGFAIIGLISSLLRISITGWKVGYIVHLAFELGLILVYIFRRKLSLQFKSYFFLGLTYLGAIAGIYSLGYFAEAKLFLIIVPVFTLLYLESKKSYYALLICLISFFVLAYLYHSNALIYTFDKSSYVNSFKPWLVNGIVILMVTAMLLVIVKTLFDAQTKALRNVRESEEKFKVLADDSTLGIFIYKTNPLLTVYVNSTIQEILGYSPDEVINFSHENLMKYVHPEDIDLVSKRLAGRIAGRQPEPRFELRVFKKDHTLAWIEVETKRIHFLGEPAILATFLDISERKKVSDEINKEKEFSDLAINTLSDTFFVFDPENGKAIRWNKAFEKISGYSYNEIQKMKAPDTYYGKEDLIKAYKATDKIIQGKDMKIEMDLICKSKEKKTFEYSGSVIPDENGEPKYIISIGRDISERKRAEQELIESEEKFRIIAEQSLLGIAISQNNKVQYINQACADMVGYEMEDILSWSPGEMFKTVHPDDREHVKEQVRKKEKNIPGYITSYNYRVVRQNGTIRIIALHSKHIKFKGEGADLIIAIDITERKKTEQALQESEERFKKLAGISLEGIMIHDQGVCVEINQAISKITGYSREELINQYVFNKLVKSEHLELVYSKMKSHYNKPFEMEIINKKGKSVPIEVIAREITWNGKKMRVGVVRDISDRKKSEQELFETNELLESIFNSTHIMIAYLDPNFNFIKVNQRYAQADNKEPEFFHGKNHFELYQNEENEILFKKTLQTGEPYFHYEKPFEYPHRPEKGTTFWDWSLIPVKEKNNKIIALVLSILEVTERIRSEIALKESEERYRWLFENMSSGVAVYEAINKGKDFIFKNFNKAGEKIDNIKKERLLNKSLLKTFPAVQEFGLFKVIQTVWKTGKPQFHPISLYEDKRVIGWRENYVYKLPSGEVVAIYDDITDKKKAEIALVESEEKFRLIFNSVADAVFILDFQGNFIEVNNIAIERYGYSREKFLTITPQNILPDHLKQVFQVILGEIKIKGFITKEVEHINAQGRIFPVELNTRKIKYNGTNAIITVARDISERKQKQHDIYNAVIRAEENERSRVAKDLHDGISPILSAIKIYAETLEEDIDKKTRKEAHKRILSTIDEAITELQEISNNLSPHILHNFGFISAIQSYIEKIECIRKIEIDFKYNSEKRFAERIEITLYRVVIELINNTLKHAKATRISITFTREKDISLLYTDNGKGFNVKNTILKKRGMGLFNITNRIEFLKGNVSIDSKTGRGTSVKIAIPLYEYKV